MTPVADMPRVIANPCRGYPSRRRRVPLWLGLAIVSMACAQGLFAQQLAVVGAEPVAARPEDLEFFESQVRPIFVEHCSECHTRKLDGREAGEPEGGLSFDSRSDFRASEGVAVAGNPEKSLIVQVIRYDSELQMPPAGKLPAGAIATLEEWVRRELPWPDDGTTATAAAPFDIPARKAEHWCWQAPQKSAAPEVSNKGWCRSDMDRFILARLESAGLKPAPEASRAVLVRRASEILTGLPADPADVDRVVADADPLAYEKYVDTLLASPHYGERFARHWLDVVRYGETRGHESDYTIPNAWRYRDWVVKAFNDGLPYDQFVREQIAGDRLEHPRLNAQTGANESIVGTGFWLLGEEVHSPVDIAQDEADRIDNRVDTFGKAFLGLALGCARCHDHKFDAISNEDYYAIAGMLMSSNYRQVPFETLAANQGVAAGLDRADAEARKKLLPLVARLIEQSGGFASIEKSLPQAAEILAAVRHKEASDAETPSSETFLANYTAGVQSTPIIADAYAWGITPLPAGQPSIAPANGTQPTGVTLLTLGAAQSDAIWSRSTTSGERDPGPVGEVDRSGRMLRTAKVRLTHGQLWYRVRGNMQVVAEIDSHRMLPGPLHGRTIISTDTKDQWQWIGHDLKTYAGHMVQVEFASKSGEAAVAEVVESIRQPTRIDPLVLALAERTKDLFETSAAPDAAVQAQAIHAAASSLFMEALEGCRNGSLTDSPHAAALATLVNRVLAANPLGGSAAEAAAATGLQLSAEATALAVARTEIAAGAKLASAVAPAILDGNGVDQHVLVKGVAGRLGALSPRRFLEAIDGPNQPAWPTHSSGRSELADRVLDPTNPLTSRVIVNRIWHHLFGRGLVATTDNFGKLGEQAADPQAAALLDALAVRFREEGWDLKQLIREITTSSTWRMSNTRDNEAVQKDPLNLLLHHYPLRRLEAEAVRDKILAVSGRLNREIGGPGVEVFLNDFQQGRGRPSPGPLDGNGRRSLYIKVRRNFLTNFLLAFDMPIPFQAMGRRTVTNVPAQALVLMNDPFVIQQANLWAKKTLADEKQTTEERINRMYRDGFSRLPDDAERGAAIDFLTQQAQQHGANFSDQPRHEAAWSDFAHALINTKEFIFVP